MPTTNCSICSKPGLKDYVDALLDKGMSNAGIAAGLEAAGGHLDPKVVARHKENHWKKPVDPGAPKATARDLAIILRDRVADAIEALPGDDIDGMPSVLNKDLAPGLSMGLKAQGLLDKREQTNKKLGLAAGYLGLQLYLRGVGQPAPEPVLLDDPWSVEGEAVETS